MEYAAVDPGKCSCEESTSIILAGSRMIVLHFPRKSHRIETAGCPAFATTEQHKAFWHNEDRICFFYDTCFREVKRPTSCEC